MEGIKWKVTIQWGAVLFFTDSKYDTDNSKSFSVPIPKNWEEFRESEWTYIIPLKNNMQRQEWKVHISSTLECTDEILTIVSEYCYKKNVVFKHLSTVKRFVNRNGKQMPGSTDVFLEYSRASYDNQEDLAT